MRCSQRQAAVLVGSRLPMVRQRAGLGHAPGVDDEDAEAALELLDDARAARPSRRPPRARSADLRQVEAGAVAARCSRRSPSHTVGTPSEKVQPSSCSRRVEALARQARAGQHQLGAAHRAPHRACPRR